MHRARRTERRLTTVLTSLLLASASVGGATRTQAQEPPPIERPEGEAEPAPQPKPESEEDRQRLERLAHWVKEVEKARDTASEGPLKIGVALIPDGRAHAAVVTYLAERGKGASHEAALSLVSRSSRELNKLRDRAVVRIDLQNSEAAAGRTTRRIYTIGEKLPDKVIAVGQGGKRVPLKFVEKPSGVRFANVRIRKFWKLADGLRPGDPDPSDGEKPGFEPILSKPIPVAVIEGGEARFALWFSTKRLKSFDEMELGLANLKTYAGPFKKDQINLNNGRTWDPISPVKVPLTLPPDGATLPEPVREVVAALGAL